MADHGGCAGRTLSSPPWRERIGPCGERGYPLVDGRVWRASRLVGAGAPFVSKQASRRRPAQQPCRSPVPGPDAWGSAALGPINQALQVSRAVAPIPRPTTWSARPWPANIWGSKAGGGSAHLDPIPPRFPSLQVPARRLAPPFWPPGDLRRPRHLGLSPPVSAQRPCLGVLYGASRAGGASTCRVRTTCATTAANREAPRTPAPLPGS